MPRAPPNQNHRAHLSESKLHSIEYSPRKEQEKLTRTTKTTVASRAAPTEDPTTMTSPCIHERRENIDVDEGRTRIGLPPGTDACSSTNSCYTAT